MYNEIVQQTDFRTMYEATEAARPLVKKGWSALSADCPEEGMYGAVLIPSHEITHGIGLSERIKKLGVEAPGIDLTNMAVGEALTPVLDLFEYNTMEWHVTVEGSGNRFRSGNTEVTRLEIRPDSVWGHLAIQEDAVRSQLPEVIVKTIRPDFYEHLKSLPFKAYPERPHPDVYEFNWPMRDGGGRLKTLRLEYVSIATMLEMAKDPETRTCDEPKARLIGFVRYEPGVAVLAQFPLSIIKSRKDGVTDEFISLRDAKREAERAVSPARWATFLAGCGQFDQP